MMTTNHPSQRVSSPPALGWLLVVTLLLSIFSYPSYAEMELPEIGLSPTPQEEDQPQLKQQLKALEDLVKEYTTYQLSDDSALQLKTDGFQIETNYRHGIVTEFEAKEEGEITFRIKIPF